MFGFLGAIADILHEDGHNVTILSPIMDPRVEMVGHTSSILQIPYESKYMDHEGYSKLEVKSSSFWEVPAQGRSMSVSDFEGFVRNMQSLYRGLAEDKVFLDRLRASRFDVAVHEIYDPYQVGIFELIGVKRTVAVSAYGITPYVREVTGVPLNPSYIPGPYTTYSDEMTFWERLDNFKLKIELEYRSLNWERETLSIFQKVHPGFPNFRDLLKQKVGAVLLNVNEFLETPRPTANIVRYVAGLSIREPKPLDEKINALLDQRSTNVLFSLGTFTQSRDMPLRLKKGIIEAFASFPNTTFIWKYEDDSDSDLFRAHPNIYRMKWIPQMDLLVELSGLSLVSHTRNELRFLRRRSLANPWWSYHCSEISSSTQKIFDEEAGRTYARKAATVARHLRGRAAAARAEVKRWVKLVAEEGQMDHLMIRARDLSFVQYNCLDIIAYLLAQFAIVLCFVVFIVKLLLKWISLSLKKSKTE
ncbi:UDP-glucoronosyl and UDP-glucosyl transferase [Ostertagia ostertagi]